MNTRIKYSVLTAGITELINVKNIRFICAMSANVPGRSESVATNKLFQLVQDLNSHRDFEAEQRQSEYEEVLSAYLGKREWQSFLTLTFRDSPWGNLPSYGWLKKCVEKVEKWNLQSGNFPMLLTLERGKHPAERQIALEIPKGTTTTSVEELECEYLTKGRLHLHGLSANPTNQFVSSFSAMWEQLAGFCKVEKPNNIEHVSGYVLKYVMKELQSSEFVQDVWMLGDNVKWLTPLRE